MNGLTFSKYADFKAKMDGEIRAAAQGFVNIGYLLKVARDTDILYESGYPSVAEFAKAEYGLTKDVVSRYIRINDRFSKDGYSMELKSEYEHFGIGKLQEMLALPDEINDVLVPQLSKEQIAEARREYQKEQQITDIEVLMEQKDEIQLEGMSEKILFHYLKEQTEIFSLVNMAVFHAESQTERVDMLYRALAPKGVNNFYARVPGEGKLMASIAGKDKEITVINMRNGTKEECDWNSLVEAVRRIFSMGNALAANDAAERYERIYGVPYALTEVEVAPVQQEEKAKQTPEATIVQQEKKTEKEHENRTYSKTESHDKKTRKMDEEETTITENSEIHIKTSPIRQKQQETLERRKEEVISNIHSEIDKLKEAVESGMWNTVKLYAADIRMDVERIEKLEAEIAELHDVSQMRLEDYEEE